jgi:hypothetical protein
MLLQENDAASLARVKKDAKLLPALVYAMEEWERKLVSTGKCSARNDWSRITGRPACSLACACLDKEYAESIHGNASRHNGQ